MPKIINGPKPKRKQISFMIKTSIHRKIKVEAAQRGIPIQDLVELVFVDFLKKPRQLS